MKNSSTSTTPKVWITRDRLPTQYANKTNYGRLAALLLLLPTFVSCGARKIQLPSADSIRVEPAGNRIDSPMQTAKIAAFIEGLPGSWGQTWHTPPASGVTLLFQKGGEITATARIGENWILVTSGTASLENTLSKVDREKLDKLLVEAQRE